VIEPDPHPRVRLVVHVGSVVSKRPHLSPIQAQFDHPLGFPTSLSLHLDAGKAGRQQVLRRPNAQTVPGDLARLDPDRARGVGKCGSRRDRGVAGRRSPDLRAVGWRERAARS
jgi:hypothetical protein